MPPVSSSPAVLTGNTIFVDVDDTLIFWDVPEYYTGPTVRIEAINKFFGGVPKEVRIERTFAINTAMVVTVKQHKEDGYNVVVWSQGGAEWASEVVRSLSLESVVDVIVDKPRVLYDDLSPKYWMPRRSQHETPAGWLLTPAGVAYYGIDEESDHDDEL